MNYYTCVLLLVLATLSQAQFYFHQPSRLQYPFHAQEAHPQHYHIAPSIGLATSQQYAHPSVVENSYRESQLPSELLKSERFYKNPHIAAALAKESWFTDKESPVIDREAEKIPREMVFKIFKNAGWIRRR
ncbi:uncharacterized protein LOC119668608 [Teleopsis dalmanni]|uniref:uncharacterized protein LOC119668607 n=1 Tax=Teleopsis dalmanni TaxID=139649 RepID=UPI0018CF2BA2|nr:uncharacterized protein LOC119668607 [Teleopsis dalmanni]XP_037934103.1 uncharacterized protein LOC119668608 [Teleopsis dalmanni]XP_037934104.1 uncharacterized protein LOC119668608 [Teleopsis dalmanni]XP_037934105.1 uncharacterized protein LOC119668608 [Teleopsis dalmanni]